MKKFFFLLIIIFLTNCSKPKTVLICGDHICVNKSEAEQFFKENLSIEVKIIDKKAKNEINLVELNLKENQQGIRKVNLSSKKETKKELKILSNKEINVIKENIKKKQKDKTVNKRIANKNKFKKSIKKKDKILKKEVDKKKEKLNKKEDFSKVVYKKHEDVFDVCTILEKCSIDQISKYLLNQGKKKGFPDITRRQFN
jgi:hypothetical protein